MAKTAAKGPIENPYSMSECEKMLDAGTWPGGHVKDDAVFHAHGKVGTPTGYTDNLEKYWIKYKKEPKVYRK